MFGQVAATNALSDIYAMGGTPILALNIVCFPTCDFPMAVLQKILEGGASQVDKAGAILAGGHSIQSSEPIYGLSVTGFVHPGAILTNSGAKAGDRLVLCKSIGTGVALLGLKAGSLSAHAEQKLLHSMTTLSDEALEVSKSFEVHAATDITGFGLLGHVYEMAKGSNLRARIVARSVILLPETLALAQQGFVPAGAYANRQAYEQQVMSEEDVDLGVMDMLYDPQTAGGLLFAVPAAQAKALSGALIMKGIEAAIIGDLQAGEPGKIEVVWDAKTD
jgi:selenide,water dikinase